jgi:hypothetical protein
MLLIAGTDLGYSTQLGRSMVSNEKLAEKRNLYGERVWKRRDPSANPLNWQTNVKFSDLQHKHVGRELHGQSSKFAV